MRSLHVGCCVFRARLVIASDGPPTQSSAAVADAVGPTAVAAAEGDCTD